MKMDFEAFILGTSFHLCCRVSLPPSYPDSGELHVHQNKSQNCLNVFFFVCFLICKYEKDVIFFQASFVGFAFGVGALSAGINGTKI